MLRRLSTPKLVDLAMVETLVKFTLILIKLDSWEALACNILLTTSNIV